MSDFLVHVVIMVALFAILALSLNVQYGMTGLSNFGQIAFFLIGAYVAAINRSHWGFPLWAEVVAALTAGALGGWLFALPTRRLKQDFWALATLAIAEILRLVTRTESWIAGGSLGTAGIRSIASAPVFMVIMLLLVLVVFLILERIRLSPFGRVLRVIRQDEVLAASLGRDVYHYQVRVMVLGGSIAAIAGLAYAHYVGFISPDAFTTVDTFFIWTMVMLGGRGNDMGVILGVAILETLTVSTRFVAGWTNLSGDKLANLRSMTYGLLLIALVLYRNGGLLPERKRVYAIPELSPPQVPAVEGKVASKGHETNGALPPEKPH